MYINKCNIINVYLLEISSNIKISFSNFFFFGNSFIIWTVYFESDVNPFFLLSRYLKVSILFD